MKEETKYRIWFIIFLLIGIAIGVLIFSSYQAGIYQVYSMGLYGCMDGCSIATKDSNGWLTNSTWDCWDKCENYIEELTKKIKGETE